jgi:hypothetical protein
VRLDYPLRVLLFIYKNERVTDGGRRNGPSIDEQQQQQRPCLLGGGGGANSIGVDFAPPAAAERYVPSILAHARFRFHC